MPARVSSAPRPARSRPRRNSVSSAASQRPASLTSSPFGPNRSRNRPIACAPPIGTTSTPSASRSPPRRSASASSAHWSLIPSTSTTARGSAISHKRIAVPTRVRAGSRAPLLFLGVGCEALLHRCFDLRGDLRLFLLQPAEVGAEHDEQLGGRRRRDRSAAPAREHRDLAEEVSGTEIRERRTVRRHARGALREDEERVAGSALTAETRSLVGGPAREPRR